LILAGAAMTYKAFARMNRREIGVGTRRTLFCKLCCRSC